MTDIESQPQWRITGMIFFGLITLLILWATFQILQPFLSAIVLGAVLVTVTFGLFRRVRARLRNRSSLAALVMLLGITFLLIVPMVVIGFLLIQQAGTLVQHLQSGEAREFMAHIDVAG